MRNHASPRNSQLEFRSGGGWLMLLGLPFLIVGAVAGSSPIWGPLKTNQGTPMPVAVAIGLGMVFCGVGLAFIFGRAGHVLDRQMGVITSWWGLLIPFRSRVRSLGDFQQVTLAREVRRSNKSSYTVFPVYLSAAQGAKIALEQPRDELEGRRIAEEAARFLDLRLVDTTQGQVITREPQELDESLRQRARRLGESVQPLPTPEGCQVVSRVNGDALELVIPPVGMTPVHQLGLLIGAGAPLLGGVMFALILSIIKLPSEWWAIVGGGLLLFFGLPAFLVALGIVRHARTETRVRITPESLVVQRPFGLRNKHATIGIDELEELTIVSGAESIASTNRRRPPSTLMNLLPSQRIVARSDRASVSFGEGLSTRELEWLKSLVQSAVTA